MAQNLQLELADLERLLPEQAAKIEEMVLTSYHALHERSLDAAKEVLGKEVEVNRSVVEIEEHCLTVLTL